MVGRLQKCFAERTLVGQPWIMDDKSSVAKALEAELKVLNSEITALRPVAQNAEVNKRKVVEVSVLLLLLGCMLPLRLTSDDGQRTAQSFLRQTPMANVRINRLPSLQPVLDWELTQRHSSRRCRPSQRVCAESGMYACM